jgi:hypothetical protein
MNAQLWVTVLGDGVVLAAALLGYASTRKRVERVHGLVNNQLDRQLDRNAVLTASLTKAGVEVPVHKPAVAPPPDR